jgi:uncharacterized protein (TIGR02246 family)
MTLATEHILAISKLLADYCHAADAGDSDAFAGLFAPDGVLDIGRAVMNGRAEIAAFAATVPERIPGVQHVTTNVSIDGDSDRAAARSYVQIYARASDSDTPLRIAASGRYQDLLQRTGGRWYLTARTMIPDS